MTRMNRAIVQECVQTTQELLEADWDDIESMRDEQDGRIKIGIAYLISFRGNEQSVKTTITFGRRVSESRESIVNPDQLEMPLEAPQNADNGEGADKPPKSKKRGVRAAQDAPEAT